MMLFSLTFLIVRPSIERVGSGIYIVNANFLEQNGIATRGLAADRGIDSCFSDDR